MFNKQQKLSFFFPSTGGGEAQGGHDPAAEFFEGIEASAVVRESLQNVIDAKDPKENMAKASFQLLHIKPKDMPGIGDLVKKYEQCIKVTPDKKIKKRFEYAKQLIINDKKIPVLKISDYGTVGLLGGDKDRKGHYYNFMKSVGSTGKVGGKTGGSFGIGKAAYLAASTVKVKFISSIYLDKSKKEYVFQGKVRLISHEEKLGDDEKQGIGFLGIQNSPYPIRSVSKIPEMFLREKDVPGTDIYIVGYEENAEWEETIIKSALTHFWMAIYKKDVEITVGKKHINKNSLEKMLYDTYGNDITTTENPLPYYLAYKKGKMHEEKSTVLGNMYLYSLKNKYPCGVAYFRITGMRIEVKYKNDTNNIAYVFVCDNLKGNDLLRDMEPPSHDRWVAARAENEKGKTRPEAQTAMWDINNFIRNTVNKENEQTQKEFETIPDLDKFFTPPKDMAGDSNKLPQSGDDPIDDEVSQSFDKYKKVKGVASSSIPKPYKPLLKTGKSKTNGGTGTSKKEKTDSETVVEADSGKLYPLGNVTIRAFAKKASATRDIKHILLIRTKPNSDITIKVSVVIEDELSSGIDIYNAYSDTENKELEITDKNLIKGAKTSSDGIVRISLLFTDKKNRHTIQVNTYENR